LNLWHHRWYQNYRPTACKTATASGRDHRQHIPIIQNAIKLYNVVFYKSKATDVPLVRIWFLKAEPNVILKFEPLNAIEVCHAAVYADRFVTASGDSIEWLRFKFNETCVACSVFVSRAYTRAAVKTNTYCLLFATFHIIYLIFGRIARISYAAYCHIYVARFVVHACGSVCELGTRVGCVKTAKLIVSRFSVQFLVGPGNHVLDKPQTGKGTLRGTFTRYLFAKRMRLVFALAGRIALSKYVASRGCGRSLPSL